MKALQDQQARDRFVTELDKNFCVSAGAGVGKTTAIVKRVAQIALRDEKQLSRLVVATYGKAAAEELRVRSRDLLLREMHGSAHRRQNLLSELRRAFFGTIHSFCLRLVQDQGRFIGLPQSVELVEGGDEEALWARFCESRALESLELHEKHLQTAMRFLSFEDLLRVARQLDPGSAEAAKTRFVDMAPPKLVFSRSLADDGGRSREQTAKNQAKLVDWLRGYENGVPFQKIPKFEKGSGTFKEAFQDEIAPLLEWLGCIAAAISAEIALAYRAYRMEQGRITYEDQIFWCHRLLEKPAILDRLRARNYVVILDEAQDADSAMFAILTEITRPPGAKLGAWPRNESGVGPEAGRFSFVGDDQQSIYSSRADPEVYHQYIEAFRKRRGGELLEFAVTMRCPRRVIGAVNEIFVSEGRLNQPFVEFRELFARPGCEEGAVWRLKLDCPDDHGKVDELFGWECEQVAKFLREHRPDRLGVRRWSDIAILCPRHKWLRMVAETFRQFELPCRLVAERKLELELARRSWPAALFHVVLNPWDRFERIGVLREMFAVSDVELAEEHLSKKRSPRLEAAASLLNRLHLEVPQKGERTLSRFVDFVFEQTQLAARLVAIGESPDALDSFRHGALQAECDGVSLRDWSNEMCRRLHREAQSIVETGDEIQILTCWKAKGLEWPVVIPLGLGRKIRPARTEYPRVQREAGGVTVHLSAATLDEAFEEASETREREELQRVLYVTFTRAKSLLVLPDSSAIYKDSRPNFLDLCKWDELVDKSFLQAPSTRTPPDGEEVRSWPRLHVAPAQAVCERAALRSKEIPRRILPHELVHDRARDLPDREPAGDIGGLDYGSWWHRTMQYFPWLQNEAARTAYAEKAGTEAAGVSAVGARGVRELRAFVAGKFHAELLARGDFFLPETPFSHPRSEQEWMEGVIDLVVVIRGGGVWIVDWKTDRRLVGESMDQFQSRLRAAYLPQLEAYAEVVRDGMRHTVERLALYSTEAGLVID